MRRKLCEILETIRNSDDSLLKRSRNPVNYLTVNSHLSDAERIAAAGVVDARAATSSCLTWVTNRMDHEVEGSSTVDLIIDLLETSGASVSQVSDLTAQVIVDPSGVVHHFEIGLDQETGIQVLELVEGVERTRVAIYDDVNEVFLSLDREQKDTLDNFVEAKDELLADSLSMYDYLQDALASAENNTADCEGIIAAGLKDKNGKVVALASALAAEPAESRAAFLINYVQTSLSGMNDVTYDDEANSFSVEDYTPSSTKDTLSALWSIILQVGDIAANIAMFTLPGIGKIVGAVGHLVVQGFELISNAVDDVTSRQMGKGTSESYANAIVSKDIDYYPNAPSPAINIPDHLPELQYNTPWYTINRTANHEKALNPNTYDILVYPKCGNYRSFNPIRQYGVVSSSVLVDENTWYDDASILSDDSLRLWLANESLAPGRIAEFLKRQPISLFSSQAIRDHYDEIMNKSASDPEVRDEWDNTANAHVCLNILRNLGFLAFNIAQGIVNLPAHFDFWNRSISGFGLGSQNWSAAAQDLRYMLLHKLSFDSNITYGITSGSKRWISILRIWAYIALFPGNPMSGSYDGGSNPYHVSMVRTWCLNNLDFDFINDLLNVDIFSTNSQNHGLNNKIPSISELAEFFVYLILGPKSPISPDYEEDANGFIKDFVETFIPLNENFQIEARAFVLSGMLCEDTYKQYNRYAIIRWDSTLDSYSLASESDVIDSTIFCLVSNYPMIETDPAVTPPLVNKRRLILTLIAVFAITAAATAAVVVCKRKLRNHRLKKATLRENEAEEASKAFKNDPSDENFKKYRKAQRRFQRYANRVGYSSNSVQSFNSKNGTVTNAGNITTTLTDYMNNDSGTPDTDKVFKVITGFDSQ